MSSKFYFIVLFLSMVICGFGCMLCNSCSVWFMSGVVIILLYSCFYVMTSVLPLSVFVTNCC
jgi:hypothetical protein